MKLSDHKSTKQSPNGTNASFDRSTMPAQREREELGNRPFSNNCAVMEVTADGVNVGRCWYYLRAGLCYRHGDVSAIQEVYVKTGKLSKI